MYSEIMIVKEALRPYQQHVIQTQSIRIHRMALRKSRDYYQIYLQQILDNISESSRDYLNRYSITRKDNRYCHVFINKVKAEKEIKLKEIQKARLSSFFFFFFFYSQKTINTLVKSQYISIHLVSFSRVK